MLPGTPASVLVTREPSCTAGAGLALTGRGCNRHPEEERDVQCRAQKERIERNIESVQGLFWLKTSKCWSVEVNTQSA